MRGEGWVWGVVGGLGLGGEGELGGSGLGGGGLKKGEEMRGGGEVHVVHHQLAVFGWLAGCLDGVAGLAGLLVDCLLAGLLCLLCLLCLLVCFILVSITLVNLLHVSVCACIGLLVPLLKAAVYCLSTAGANGCPSLRKSMLDPQTPFKNMLFPPPTKKEEEVNSPFSTGSLRVQVYLLAIQFFLM